MSEDQAAVSPPVGEGFMFTNDPIGYVYFVLSPTHNLIKIGFSKNHPDSRLRMLQTGSPDRLVRICYVQTRQSMEKVLHERFKEHRSHGEWFRDHVQIRGYIALHGQTWEKVPHSALKSLPKQLIRISEGNGKTLATFGPYRGIRGSANWLLDAGRYRGWLQVQPYGSVKFYATSREGLYPAYERAVDRYLALTNNGRTPQRRKVKPWR